MTIDEAQGFKIDPEDKKTLQNFKNSKEWGIQKKVVEDYILKLTANLVTGTEIERGARIIELDKLSGFIYYWKKIKSVIEL